MFTQRSLHEQELYNTRLDFSTVTVESIQQHLARIKQLYVETYNGVSALREFPEKIHFSTVVQPFIDLDIYIEKAQMLCILAKETHIVEAVRKASAEAAKEIEKTRIACQQREDVFVVLHQYAVGAYQGEKSQLHPEHQSYFEDLMHDYWRSGLCITDNVKKARITEVKQQISMLSIEFQHNLDEDTTHFTLSASELNGLPTEWFTREREVSSGMYKVTLQAPDLFPILEYAKDRNIRKKLFTAFNQRCEAENLPILKKLLELRNELAHLLGYQTYADYAIEARVAGSSREVKTFLDDMNQRFTPLLERNLKDLTVFARDKEHDDNLQLEEFDMRYYMRLREKAMYDIDMEKIKEYFPLQRVINGTLSIYEKLLGLKFIERRNSDAWHQDVIYFDAYNEDSVTQGVGEKIGGFYLDLYPRDGKYAHAEAISLQRECDISHISGLPHDRQLGISAMICNFPRNENLSFEDVTTFFHELGHVMHYICSRTKLGNNGGEYTEVDFVEAPSQMLEYWCYVPEVLQMLSSHSQTQEPLPTVIAMQIAEQSKIHAGYAYKRQLAFAYFDFYVHSMPSDELSGLDVKQYFNRLQAQITQLPAMPETCFPASFDHIAGEYDAGYYGYLMSETYAADMYAAIFQKNPLSAESGMQYRRAILEPGASKSGREMLRDFLGREPSVDAFLHRYGLDVSRDRKRRWNHLSVFAHATTSVRVKRVDRGDVEDDFGDAYARLSALTIHSPPSMPHS